MSFTTKATTDLAGGTPGANANSYGGGTGGTALANLTGASATILLHPSTTSVYPAAGAWSDLYGFDVALSTSARIGGVCQYRLLGGGNQNGSYWAVGVMEKATGKFYSMGRNHGTGHWVAEYGAAIGSATTRIADMNGASGQPADVPPAADDNIYILYNPVDDTINIWVGTTAWNGGAGTPTWSIVGGHGFAPDRFCFFCYNTGVTATVGPHWGAPMQALEETASPLVAGVLTQTGRSKPNLAAFVATPPTAGTGAKAGQLEVSATGGGSGFSTIGSSQGMVANANNYFYDTAPTAGTSYYRIHYTDAGAGSVYSPEITVIVPSSSATSSGGLGEVVLAGLIGGSAGISGNPLAAAFDGDRTTSYKGTAANGQVLTMDAGIAVIATGLRVMPRRGDGTFEYENFIINGKLQGANASNFSGAVDLVTIPTPTALVYPSYQFYEFAVVGAAAYRYYRYLGANGTYSTLAEFEVVAQAGTAAQAQPVAPTIRGNRYGNTSVAITQRTTDASAYYTLDGSAVTTGKTLYTGAFDPGASSVVKTLRFASNHASLTSPLSNEITTYFAPKKFVPKMDWYDTDGVLIEARDGHVFWRKGWWYWVGVGSNLANATANDLLHNYGVNQYRSRDLINWENMGVVLPPCPKSGGGNWNYAERPHVNYCAATGKYVLLCHLTHSHSPTDYTDNMLGIATADPPADPDGVWTWTWAGTGINTPTFGGGEGGVADCNTLLVGTTLYLIYSRISNNGTGSRDALIAKLNASYTGFGGGVVQGTDYQLIKANSGEGFGPLVDPSNNNVVICIGDFVYYDSNQNYNYRYYTATSPLGTYTEHLTSPYAGGSPTNSIYNGQMTQFLWLPTKGVYINLADYWIPNPFYDSRYVWLPTTLSGTPSVPSIAKNPSWYFSDLSDVSPITTVGVSPGTPTVARNATQLFAATVSGAGGTPPQEVVWICTGGTIVNGGANDGLWTAPNTPGTYTITARAYREDGTYVDGTATVSVPAPTPASSAQPIGHRPVRQFVV